MVTLFLNNRGSYTIDSCWFTPGMHGPYYTMHFSTLHCFFYPNANKIANATLIVLPTCRKIELGISRNFQLLWAWIFLNIQGISTAWISLKKLAGIGRLNILEYSWNSKLKVLPNCKLGISWIFLNIQAANTGKLLPENPTNHADSRTFKNIQGVHKTLDILESSWICMNSWIFW